MYLHGAYIYHLSDDNKVWKYIYVYCDVGSTRLIEAMQSMCIDIYAFYLDSILENCINSKMVEHPNICRDKSTYESNLSDIIQEKNMWLKATYT